MSARRVSSAYLLVLLTSALFISVFSVAAPTPAHAAVQVNFGLPVYFSPNRGPAGQWVTFGPVNVTGIEGTVSVSSCKFVSTYTNFFSPKTGTPAASPVDPGGCSVTAKTWIGGTFKVRDQTEIDSTYPLFGANYTLIIDVTLSNGSHVTPAAGTWFIVTPKIEFALTNLSPWKNNVGHDSSIVAIMNQTVFVHGWGFNSSDATCDFASTGLTLGTPSCSASQGELTDGQFTVKSSGSGVPVKVSGQPGSAHEASWFRDSANGTVSVMTGPSIVLAPLNGSRGTKVSISGIGFSLSDSDTCAVSYSVTGGGPLYTSLLTSCKLTTVGSWRQPSATFEVALTATPFKTYFLTVTGTTGDNATFPFLVLPMANLTLSSSSGSAGSVVTMKTPGPTFFSFLDVGLCTVQSGPINIIGASSCFIAYNATAGGGTLFLSSFIVSASAPSGTYTVTVRATPDGTGAYSQTVGYAILIKVTLDPTSGSPPLGALPGTTVHVTGSGFSSVDTGCTIVSSRSNSSMPNIVSGLSCAVASGVLTATFVVAAGATNFWPTLVPYNVTVTGTPGGDKANATFKIDPRILLTPSAGTRGLRIDLSGSGFAGGTAGPCTLFAASPILIFDTAASRHVCSINPDGTATGQFWVNSTAPDGGYLLMVQGRSAGDVASIGFPVGIAPTITFSPSPTTAGTLITVTGSGWSSVDTIVTLNVTARVPAAGKYRDIWSPLNSTMTCPISSGSVGTCTFTLLNALGGTRVINATGDRGDFTTTTFVVNTRFTMSPGSGARGTVVTLSGSGFKIAEPSNTTCSNDFNIGVAPSPLVSGLNCTIDEHGTLTGVFKVIRTSSAGLHTITVVNSTLVSQGSVASDSGYLIYEPTITLSRYSGPRAAMVSVNGNYFNVDDTSCSFTGVPGPTSAVQPGTTTCNISGGVVTASFQVNNTAVPGIHGLTVTGNIAVNDAASASIVITPGITLLPTFGRPGTNVLISGSNFVSGDTGPCTITSSPGVLISSPLCTIAGGTMSGSFIVSSGAAGADYVVSVMGLTGHSGSATFTVPPGPTFILDKTSGSPGTLVSASGSNYAGITCLIAAVPSGLFSAVGSACSIVGGTLSGSFTVASGASTGSYLLTLNTNAPGESLTTPFVVSPTTTTTAATTTTSTSTATSTPTTTQTTTATTTATPTTTIQTTSSVTSVTTSVLSTTTNVVTSTAPYQLPKCIIATATFGSEASPAVQFLRGFRDHLVLSTRAGSAFMEVFNAWYYSFSPSVAGFIAANDPIRAPVRAVLYPLLGVLGVSTFTYSLLSSSPEFAVVVAGLVTSSLIGLVYLTVPALLGMRALLKRRAIAAISIAKVSMASLATALLLLVAGEIAGSFVLLAIGSSVVVLTCIITVPVLSALAILRANPK